MGFFNKIFGGNSKDNEHQIEWIAICSEEELSKVIEQSNQTPVAIFKHSTRCSISSMAKNRLERGWDFEEKQGPQMYYLDLIAYRNISDKIASILGVQHESPQLILLDKGKVIYHKSHSGISVLGIHQALKNN